MSNPVTAVVTFALPEESREFLALLTDQAQPRKPRGGNGETLPTIYGRCDGRTVAVVHTGVGHSHSSLDRVREIIAVSGIARKPVISVGYGGGLWPGIKVGDLILGENFSDPSLMAIAEAALGGEPVYAGMLTTQPFLAESVAAKAALAAETGAIAVDMETAWIAEACQGSGVPLLSLRAISDAAEQGFPVPGDILFDVVRQRPRYVALPAWLLAHPWRIPAFVQFVRGLRPARTRLTRALRAVLANL